MADAAVAELAEQPSAQALTRRKFRELIAAGCLGPGDQHITLIAGEPQVVQQEDPEHAFRVRHLTRLLLRLIADRPDLDAHYELALAVTSLDEEEGWEPVPDVMVVAAGPYRTEYPRPHEVHRLAEVGYSQPALDIAKAARYAEASIPAVLLVNVPEHTISLMTGPREGGTWDILDPA